MCVLTAGVGGLYFVAHVLFFKSVFCWFEQELLVESQKSELQKSKRLEKQMSRLCFSNKKTQNTTLLPVNVCVFSPDN